MTQLSYNQLFFSYLCFNNSCVSVLLVWGQLQSGVVH